MTNEQFDREYYKFPDSDTLRNKLDIRDPDEFNRVERLLVRQRIEEGAPKGNFDLQHLQSIHRHLFQDIYSWAGEIRKVDFHKGGVPFLPKERIQMGMADVHKRLQEDNFLNGLKADQFAQKAGVILGDVNLVHPFREGNGRTQLQYLKQLGAHAGHEIDLARIDPKEWIKASIEANRADYERMGDQIRKTIRGKARSQQRDRGYDRER